MTPEQQITIEVPGPIIPKGRPRFNRAGQTFTPKATREYEKHVYVCSFAELVKWRHTHKAHWNATPRFSLSCFLFFHDRRKRDLDNCVKAISDALQPLLYADDAQIDELYAYRDYDKVNPRAVVTVRAL